MRIRQHAIFLKSMIDDAVKGNMAPAAMQRPYVWTCKEVEELCDSIISGFPIGSFVTWVPKADQALSNVASSRLGPIARSGAKQQHMQLLLDGQNRLASIAWASLQKEADPSLMLHPEETKAWASGKSLVLDGERKAMVFVSKEEADIGFRVPAWVVLNIRIDGEMTGAQYLREKWNTLEAEGAVEADILDFLKFVDVAQAAFSDARCTVTSIEDATVEEARNAFLRVCRVGVQMSQEDFDRAVNWKPA